MLKTGELIECSALQGIHSSKLAAGQYLHKLDEDGPVNVCTDSFSLSPLSLSACHG